MAPALNAVLAAAASVVLAASLGLALATPAIANAAGAQSLASKVTGIPASRLTLGAPCPAPAPGEATCDLRVVELRATGRPAHARVVRVRAPAALLVRRATADRRRAHELTQPAASPSAQAPPQADTPAWLQQAYDLTALSADGGVGKTVAIIDAWDNPDAQSDLDTFRSEFGLPACTVANGCLREVNQNGANSPLPAQPPSADAGWQVEEDLDLDAVSAICPNCHILYVEADNENVNNLQTAQQTADRMGTNAISDSWSATSNIPIGGPFTFTGVATVAASGDAGTASSGQVAYPAALPDVSAAGGTTLAPGSLNGRGFTETAWDDGGSGCATGESAPAWQGGLTCDGRAYNDLAADADPSTGLSVYSTQDGGWVLAGGTSLATPIIAAYYAITGLAATTPAWAYSDASELNDVIGGSDGSCSLSYICTAGAGYDGPTGNGSISGDVARGAPGIGGPASVDEQYATRIGWNSATLAGSIYPNGLDTHYWLQWGATSSYGNTTSVVDVGSGRAAVSVAASLSGLQPGGTYHYRLVAQNADGTSYGYDYAFTTWIYASAPQPQGNAAQINGNAAAGQTLTAQEGQWLPLGAASYQWYVSSDGESWSAIPGATAQTYAIPTASNGEYLAFIETQTNSKGSNSETSNVVGPVTGGTAPQSAAGGSGSSGAGGSTSGGAGSSSSSTELTGIPILGSLLNLVGGALTDLVGSSVTISRCAPLCVQVSSSPYVSGTNWKYTLTKADVGAYIVGALQSGGASQTIGVIGPVTSPTAAAAAIDPGAQLRLRSTTHAALVKASARTIAAPGLESGARRVTVSFTRIPHKSTGRAPIELWVYVTSSGAPVGGRTATLRANGKRKSLTVTLPAGDALELAARSA